MKCVYRLRPYEAVPGSVNAMHEKWKKICQDFVSHGYPSRRRFNRLCREIIEDFDNNIKLLDVKKPRVGVVGEILVKFLPAANNHLVELLESEGAEAVVPDLSDFLLYSFYNQNFKVEKLGFEKSKARIGNLGIKFLEWLRKPATNAFAASKNFDPPARIQDLGKMASEIVSLGNQTGGRLVPDRRNAGTHSKRRTKHCMYSAVCLSSKPCGRKRCHQRTAKAPSRV